MQLLNKPKTVGTGLHRCGWPYVMDHLKHLDTGSGIVFDDFLEQTFTFAPYHNEIPQILQQQPWITMAHCPPTYVHPFTYCGFINYPAWGLPGSRQALENLRGICTMSHHLADRFRSVCDIPVHVIHYPTHLNVPKFNLQAYLRQPTLLHVGWFLKNLLLLEHIAPTQHIKHKIQIHAACLPHERERQIKQYLATNMYPDRALYGGVEYIDSRLPDITYDTWLANSVIASEFVDCAATTVVVEALARCTPMLLNRHPALIEYVGEAYPMFFDNIEECEQLLHPDNVVKTHEYIQDRNRNFLQVSSFTEQFRQWVNRHE
jgi:hypothetical protein